MRSAEESGNGSQGMILIVVLWAVSLMTLTVVAISALSQKSLSLAGAETDRARSELALEAGVAAAQALIMAKKPEDRVFFNGVPVVIDLGGGRLAELSIRDASGLLDLNRAEPVLVELFLKKSVEDPKAGAILLKAISELRPDPKDEAQKSGGNDAVSNPQPLQSFQQQPGTTGQGTSQATGQVQSTPSQRNETPPAPFIAAFGQLYGLPDVPDTVLDKLLPLITLYSSQGGKVNPLAAPDAVLRAIPGFSDRELKAFETARQRKQWQTPEINAILGSFEKFMAITEPRTFAVSVRLVQGPGIIAGSRLVTSILSDATGKEAFQVMAWSW